MMDEETLLKWLCRCGRANGEHEMFVAIKTDNYISYKILPEISLRRLGDRFFVPKTDHYTELCDNLEYLERLNEKAMEDRFINTCWLPDSLERED